MHDRKPGLRLTEDEMFTIRVMVEHSWRFTPDPRFIRQVLEDDSPTRTTVRGARHYGWLSSGVPEIVLGDFSNTLIGEGIPKTLPTYEEWKEWKVRVAEAHADWVRKKDEVDE
ncbi:hypothetical protein FE633_17105 [Streptomyces montanus]|uniref:Uncharacterized protein n=1 Tax=Streptomyces montanus TaxID=2580423 RepID=A0A5R9FQD7_9ACTN|nr:hypothetical protein [Streptomyces montanus]TLS44869.1 hypothetical protein FE633_17105 [Streptomyces montanus]